MAESVAIVETPRDAFQGLRKLVPLAEKIRYVRALLDAGFRHVDLGGLGQASDSPQLADSLEIIKAFRKRTRVERIAIVMHERGLEQAFNAGGLDAIGFPFSLSPHFQSMNGKVSTTQTWPLIEKIIARVEQHDMSFILYLSMAFGSSFNEKWNEEELFTLIRALCAMGVRHISLADTVAVARPEQVRRVFLRARAEQPRTQFSAHFHSRPDNWFDCVEAALDAGCRRFDAALGGLGGCPHIADALVANIPSDELAQILDGLGYKTGVDLDKLKGCIALAKEFQKKYG
jgi:hydroxymethylglutaryl-CoA lyase